MIELIQITNDPVLARRCDALTGIRLCVDLERLGKAERQAGRDTFISAHEIGDVAKLKSQLKRSRLMVRVNPMNPDTPGEVEAVLDQGADMLMLPMFSCPRELHDFTQLVNGRVPIVALLETADALSSAQEWIGAPGLTEVFVGLNDLHLSLGQRFMFEPLALGMLDRVAALARERGLDFGFGGIARLDEGLLPGRDVLAEHVRLGSRSVILSRTYHRSESVHSFEDEVALLRVAEAGFRKRGPEQAMEESKRISAAIAVIAQRLVAAE
jgi:hypothetical protein